MINTEDVDINVLINSLSKGELVKLANSYWDSIRFLKRNLARSKLNTNAENIIFGIIENLEQILEVVNERIKGFC